MTGERPLWEEVTDKPGAGYFEMTIKEGESEPITSRVPTRIASDWEERKYRKSINTPVIAYRFGPEGMCVVMPNPGIVQSGTLTNTYTREAGAQITATYTQTEFFGDAYMFAVPDSGACIKINALAITGIPFETTVRFVPSPKTS
jgi:hypothetical protein